MADREVEKDVAAMILGARGGKAGTKKQLLARRKNAAKATKARRSQRKGK
jgi:hypothetical protein